MNHNAYMRALFNLTATLNVIDRYWWLRRHQTWIGRFALKEKTKALIIFDRAIDVTER